MNPLQKIFDDAKKVADRIFGGAGDGPILSKPDTQTPSPVAVADKNNAFGLMLSTCDGGSWWVHIGIEVFAALLILIGILGVIFGNEKVDQTVIETAAKVAV